MCSLALITAESDENDDGLLEDNVRVHQRYYNSSGGGNVPYLMGIHFVKLSTEEIKFELCFLYVHFIGL